MAELSRRGRRIVENASMMAATWRGGCFSTIALLSLQQEKIGMPMLVGEDAVTNLRVHNTDGKNFSHVRFPLQQRVT